MGERSEGERQNEHEPSSGLRRAGDGPLIARIAEVTAEGFVMVKVRQDAPARAWVSSSLPLARLVAAARENAPVLVDFIDGDPRQPVVIALLVDRVEPEALPRRIALEATEAITLSCGAGAVELHRDGHVELRGDKVHVEAEQDVALRGARIDLN